MRKLTEEVKELTERDVKDADSRSLEDIQNDLSTQLASLKSKIMTKYGFIPTDLKDVSYDSEKL